MSQLVAIARAWMTAVMLLTMAACGESPGTQKLGSKVSEPENSSVPAAPKGATASIDVCALLTDGEIERTTGYPVVSKKPMAASGNFSGCEWNLGTDGAAPGLHRISLDVRTSGGRDRFKMLSALKPVPDLGDGAVQTGGNMDGTVWAVVRDTLITLRYALPVTTPDANPLVLPLVKMVVARQT
jgi:hypothetical protein